MREGRATTRGYAPGAGSAFPGVRDTAHAVRAEWTKLRTVPSTWWLLLAAVVVTAAVGAGAVGGLSTAHCPPAGCREDVVKTSLAGVWAGQAAVAVLASLAFTAEYGTGTIRTTLTAVPARLRVLAAKSAVVAAAVLVAGGAGVLGALLAGRAVVPAGFDAYDPGAGPVLRAGFGTALYLVLVALLALGLGAALRDTAGSVAACLGVLYAAPLVAGMVSDPEWVERLQRYGPASAGLAVQSTVDTADLPIGPWAGLGVLAAWSAAALALGAAALRHRDA
ncbi:ABC transporter permease subunit [Streptomyces sp. WMMC500]|uniref:ABC transporter permease subunit n=1 Tax=Streptomyces sp. WMMC500 TaxID=3015154 RepID=UPI00248CECC3|nr:ABC transporter permease subunit [Streptomyces sp. WMMC500]WBB57999.1 ABC transporter permease subunit [Streptomyces sp. WMMC500]